MALSFVAVTHALGHVLVVGTSVGPTLGVGGPAAPIPDNCRTVRVTNPSALDFALVGIAAIGTPLVEGVNAQRIPPGTFLDFDIGTISQRGGLDPGAGHGELGFVYDSDTNPIDVEVTYFNVIGEKV